MITLFIIIILVVILDILPARWSGMSLERFVLEHDGDSSLRSSEVPRMEKGNKCLENENCLHSINNQFSLYLVSHAFKSYVWNNYKK